MRRSEVVWRERIWIWLPALLFVLANLVAFGVYRLGYSNRLAALDKDLDNVRANVEAAKAGQRDVSSRVELARASRTGVASLYADSFSTRKRRLTQVTAEVKELAKKAGLDPRSLSYPEETIDEYGLVRRSFNFSVGGSYEGVRRFLNFLELTPSFLTLESMDLTSSTDPSQDELKIELKLSTLFALDEDDPFAKPRTRTAAQPATPSAPASRAPAGGIDEQ